jgi:hypothetical protein
VISRERTALAGLLLLRGNGAGGFGPGIQAGNGWNIMNYIG